jgi:hypothetical protein
MANLKIWSRVQAGSTLEVSCESSANTFDAWARFLPTTGNEEAWSKADLVPGPKRKRLTVSSAVRIAISFLGTQNQDVVVNARIVKADGSVHGEPYRETFRGKGGDTPARATLVIALKKDGTS